MKFRQDLIKFSIGLFVGMSLFEVIMKGNIETKTLIGNAIGAILGGIVYAYWTNRRTRHEIFQKKR